MRGMKQPGIKVLLLTLILAVFCNSALFGTDRAAINVNLIIDSSASLTAVKADITTWVNGRLDQILMTGDKITVWSAGQTSRVIYTGTINSQADREAVKRSISALAGSGFSADFSSALREAAGQRNQGINFTMLISASPASLAATISGPQGNLLRFSRVEEFSGWRAIVIGLNMETRIKGAATAFLDS